MWCPLGTQVPFYAFDLTSHADGTVVRLSVTSSLGAALLLFAPLIAMAWRRDLPADSLKFRDLLGGPPPVSAVPASGPAPAGPVAGPAPAPVPGRVADSGSAAAQAAFDHVPAAAPRPLLAGAPRLRLRSLSVKLNLVKSATRPLHRVTAPVWSPRPGRGFSLPAYRPAAPRVRPARPRPRHVVGAPRVERLRHPQQPRHIRVDRAAGPVHDPRRTADLPDRRAQARPACLQPGRERGRLDHCVPWLTAGARPRRQPARPRRAGSTGRSDSRPSWISITRR